MNNQQSITTFPKNFHWGASAASYQVEGGIENTDWAQAAREGRVPPCGLGCDHFHRYEEDFDLAKSLGHTAHRLSIEWARIEPDEGKFDESAIAHYRKVLEALHARGLTPMVTLWHFTVPLWFSEKGGFEQRNSPEIFARYCAYVTGKLADLCTHFSTINEPNVYASHGWLYGAWPPFKRGRILHIAFGKDDGTSHSHRESFRHVFEYMRVLKNLARAHNRAYEAIKTAHPSLDVSLVKHVRVFQSNGNPFNMAIAAIARYAQSGYFMNKVYQRCDSIGLNYYRHTTFGREMRKFDKTDMGWDIFPEGIYFALAYLWRYKKPLYVTEAGVADAADAFRADYIKGQVDGVRKALAAGIDVRSHMYWSLLDNYEWALGFKKRFGLIEIDYATLKRTPRPSAYVYKGIIEKERGQNTT